MITIDQLSTLLLITVFAFVVAALAGTYSHAKLNQRIKALEGALDAR